MKKLDDSNNILILEDLVSSLSDCAVLLDSNKTVISVNSAAAKFFGVTTKSLKGKSISELLPELNEKSLSGLRQSEHMEFGVEIEKRGIEYIDLCLNKLKIAKKSFYLLLIRDISGSRKSGEENEMHIKALELNTHLLVEAVKCTTDMISITDSENRFTYVNKAFLDNYGYSLKEIIGKKPDVISASPDLLSSPEEIFEMTKSGGWHGEIMNRRKDGSVFPIILSTTSIIDKSGKALGFIGIAREITDLHAANEQLRQSLKEKEVLLKEIYHRVKNNLQVITSLLHIQSTKITDPAALELLRESRDRIRMMALLHEKLYQSEDLSRVNMSEYLNSLGNYFRQSYPVQSNMIELTIKSQNVYLGVDKAIPCGLIVNEIVSNSYKYAFIDRMHGEIMIEFGSPGGDKYLLTVGDDGIGIPLGIDFGNASTMGMVLINTLTQQIDGSVEMDRTSGTKYTITF